MVDKQPPQSIERKEKEKILKISPEEYRGMVDFVNNHESEAWDGVLELRSAYEESSETIFAKIPVETIDEAREKSFSVIHDVLESISDVIDLDNIDAGHGVGHVVRDYVNALIVSEETSIDPKHQYIGIVAGVLHDVLGCSLIERYSETTKAVRHAEAGGLFFLEISKKIGLDQDEAKAIAYAISAHTHYLSPMTVECSDGVERITTPYPSTDQQGEPDMAICLPRFVDRLDLMNPAIIGRNALVSIKDIKDYDGSNFFDVQFDNYMRPLLRTPEEIESDPSGKTLLEHTYKLVQTQNSDSPYGQFDRGTMITLREYYKGLAFDVFESVDCEPTLTEEQESDILLDWVGWLKTIEPSSAGSLAAEKFKDLFSALPYETQKPWFNIMAATMHSYDEWAKNMQDYLATLPQDKLVVPLLGNVSDILAR